MFCDKCGNVLATNAHFCNRCGEKVAVPPEQGMKRMGQTAEMVPGKAKAFLKGTSLFFGGLIMSLLTFPMYIWFELQGMPAVGVIREYASVSAAARHELDVWNKADLSHGMLGAFSCVAAVVLVLGIALCIMEGKGIVRRSRLRNICCIAIPTVVGAVVAICTYPAIFECILTFDYLYL